MPTPTGRALGLLGILLFIFLLLFRLYFARIRSLLGFRGIFLLRLFLLFLISFFCYCLRIDFLSRIGLYVSPLALFIFNVGSGGSGQALPLPSPSVPPSSPPRGDAEISFSMEPHPGLDLTLRLGQPIQRGEAIYQAGVEGEVPQQEEAPLCPIEQRIKARLCFYNSNKGLYDLDQEIRNIIFLKNEIINRMSQLDQDSFWVEHRNRIISEAILNNEGREYRIDTLRRYLDDLSSANPTDSYIFKTLTKMRKDFQTFGFFFSFLFLCISIVLFGLGDRAFPHNTTEEEKKKKLTESSVH